MPCGTSSIAVPDPSDDRAAAIARLNDAVRLGRDRKARIVITRGVVDLLGGGETLPERRTARTIVHQVRLRRQIALAPIDPGDDPYGERDFGALTFMDERLFWKIDAYADDGSFSLGSEMPWDEGRTIRVLTIMRADEY
jgi:hypothetical protein